MSPSPSLTILAAIFTHYFVAYWSHQYYCIRYSMPPPFPSPSLNHSIVCGFTRVQLVCLNCSNIHEPHLCDNVSYCSVEEYCGTQRIFTKAETMTYTVGCFNKSTCHRADHGSVDCTECCREDLCNADGCGATGYQTNKGVICHSCSGRPYHDVTQCTTIEHCTQDQICYVDRILDANYTGFKSGCRSKHACGHVSPVTVGRRRAVGDDTTPCNRCCNDTLCNNRCIVCDNGYEHVGDMYPCFKYYHYIADYASGSAQCTRDGGHLLTVTNKKMIDTLLSYYEAQIGVGINHWLIDGRLVHNQWIDWQGRPLKYTIWLPSGAYIPTGNCLRLYGGGEHGLAPAICSPASSHFICQKE